MDDADVLIARAGEAGATLGRAPSDASCGERSSVVRDPFGHEWDIGGAIERLTSEEGHRRYAAPCQSQ